MLYEVEVAYEMLRLLPPIGLRAFVTPKGDGVSP